ncbi:MAG: glycosyltransferase [Bacteroidales bacterium]|nr:glycosyltransferase [Bacteroidales bacterium]
MRILLLCNKSPWPPLEGGPIAMNAMATGLLEAGHQVKVLAINSNKYNVSLQSVPEEYRKRTGFQTVYIDLSVKPWPAFLNLFTGKSYHVERFISLEFSSALTTILKTEKFDIIQFETLFTSPDLHVIRSLSDARIVLRAHNIEHLIWQRSAAGCRNPLKKLYLRHLARTLKRYELKTINEVDGIVAITEKDAAFFRQAAPGIPVTAIPFGIRVEDAGNIDTKLTEKIFPGLFHLGSMNWIPNQEGIGWFIRKVWPIIYGKHQDLRFYLAGREMPGWLKNINVPGIVVDGEVPDARSYMFSHGIMIVPLFSGSGIRIKIIEGMLAGKAIITTAIGAEGISYTDGINLLIANDLDGFIDAIEKCLNTPGLVENLGRQARELVIKKHNNTDLMQNISDFYIKIQQHPV